MEELNLINLKQDDNRIKYLDCLRIIATFLVIVIHVISINWYDVAIETFEWKVLTFYDAFSRWAVPIFVMISGVLFLGKAQEINKLYKKNILRMVVAFLVWAIVYALIYIFSYGFELKSFVAQIIGGYYHLWFLFMIVGIYMVVPFLNKIVESDILIKYFLSLAFGFNFLIPFIIAIISIFSDTLGSFANETLNKMNLYMISGYVSYFIAGYYLNKIELKTWQKRIIYFGGIIGFLVTILFTIIFSQMQQEKIVSFFDYNSLNVMLMSVAIFVFAKSNFNKLSNKKIEDGIKKLSKCTFGIYLIHVIFIEQFNLKFNFNSISFNPVFSVPIISIIVFVISALFSKFLNRIPIINKIV